MTVLFSGVVAFLVNLSIYWIIGNTSPVTYPQTLMDQKRSCSVSGCFSLSWISLQFTLTGVQGLFWSNLCKYEAFFGLLVFLIFFRGVIGFLWQLWELHMCSSLIERVAELLKRVFKKFFTVNLFMSWKDLKSPWVSFCVSASLSLCEELFRDLRTPNETPL